MNLKRLLMLVAATVLVVPTTLSVVACNGPELKKIDSVITTTQLQEITVPRSDKSNKPSPEEVLAAIDKINKISLSKEDITITVKDDSDAIVKGIGNYDGTINVTFTTKIIKTNLNTIFHLTGVTFSLDKTKKYYQLNDEIVKADEFKNYPLVDGYTIHYYYTSTSTTDMTDWSQGSGANYVVIEASINDSYWSNQTYRIKVVGLDQ